jgi:hypothetical protein
MSFLLLKNFKFEGEVREFRSFAIYYLSFKLLMTEDTVEAKLLFFDSESLLTLLFKLTLVNLFFYSLVVVVNFWVAENFLLAAY